MKYINIKTIGIDADLLINEIKADLADVHSLGISYLIMSSSTFEILNKIKGESKPYQWHPCPVVQTKKYFTICGFPIAICDKLEFGEVEIV